MLFGSLSLLPMFLAWRFIKKFRAESAAQIQSDPVSAAKSYGRYEKAKRNFVFIWIGVIGFTLTMPWWMPTVSGVQLSFRANIAIALITATTLSIIMAIRLRTWPKPPP